LPACAAKPAKQRPRTGGSDDRLGAGARLDAVADGDLCLEERAQRVPPVLLTRGTCIRAYLPRDVFFTFAVFFAAFAGWSRAEPEASALSFCFLVAISTIDSWA
jgi:hypothetical protein